jgi:hypothetical protein
MNTAFGSSPLVAMDEHWMEIELAAAYAAVPQAELEAAINRREVVAVSWHPLHPGVWMLHRRDVETWATARPAVA